MSVAKCMSRLSGWRRLRMPSKTKGSVLGGDQPQLLKQNSPLLIRIVHVMLGVIVGLAVAQHRA